MYGSGPRASLRSPVPPTGTPQKGLAPPTCGCPSEHGAKPGEYRRVKSSGHPFLGFFDLFKHPFKGRWFTVTCAITLVSLCGSLAFAQPPGRGKRGKHMGKDEAPKLGADAPNFKLKLRKGDRQVELADFKGEKPVVLVFGSYT